MPKDPDSLVDLATANSELEAREVVGDLASRGIPSDYFSLSTPTMRFLTSDAIRIMVRRVDFERAQATLREFRARPAFSDWSEVDVGDVSALRRSEIGMMGMVCLSCGYDLSGTDLEKSECCPECGIGFAEMTTDPASDGEQTNARRSRRASHLALAVMCAIGILIVLCFAWDTHLLY